MNILVTVARGTNFDTFFPLEMREQFERLGHVTYSSLSRTMTKEELMMLIPDKDIVVSHWGSPQVDKDVLQVANRLKVIAHCAGTLTHIMTEDIYDRGIIALSANHVMAKFVAEATLGYMICMMRQLPRNNDLVKSGRWKNAAIANEQMSLFDRDIGLVGLGSVGRVLLDMLVPFRCRVHIYDPYITPERIARWPNAKLCSLEEAMSQSVVSVHAAKTPETYHIINEKTLALMPDHGVFINTARGSLVDEAALAKEISSGRLYAYLDVYDKEPPVDSPLRACRTPEGGVCHNLQMNCHLAGFDTGTYMTQAILDDLNRLQRGEKPIGEIRREQFKLMTQE